MGLSLGIVEGVIIRASASSSSSLLSLFPPQPEKMDEPPPLGDIGCLEDCCIKLGGLEGIFVGAIVGIIVLRTYSVG